MQLQDSPTAGGGMTLSDQVGRHARRTPDAVAIRYDDAGTSYRELDQEVNRLARVLGDRGVGPGDRVAVLAHNHPVIVAAILACTRIGAIAVPLNFRCVAAEIEYMLGDCGAVFLIVDTHCTAVAAAALPAVDAVRGGLVVGGPGTSAGLPFDDYTDALAAASATPVETVVDERTPALIMYTSGTTGRPKGAVLTHQNLFVQVTSRIAHSGIPTTCRVWLVATPLFHIGGISAVLQSTYLGGTLVIAGSREFDPAGIVDLFERERVSSCFLVPQQWQAVCAVPGISERDLSALTMIAWGGAPASTTLLSSLIDTFAGAELSTSFGQTECCPITTVLRGADARRKIGSIGTPLLNVEVRIVDPEMNDVPRGEVGEIVYRGPSIMSGYWNKPDENEAAFRGGWFHSGDLVREDEDGYLYLVDRLKDMIISGGENVYCAEVENTIAAHPAVAEVAVIGLSDPRWGEVPHAVIVARPGATPPSDADVEQWCRDRLAAYKCPRHITLMSALPRNAGGKVIKAELRTQLPLNN
ncbi:long-chain-fatty-acid--CoA ligase [Gordonia rubripertincta]|uniref:Long-chain-fatty-acid--CoA ligase n=1 Tax=Gordonia rubripertincta TaxID=36822 RepID=A0ABT4MZK9_GORRU|nr:long-chain-fatty-acid--CoA ligase [Gordonia rubripertincta]MCZ4551152.1 long-chain-fatty-acid--CoA ligase [Gordonia rubripertincta]